MSHYSGNPGRVRVDLFRETGKWYATGSIDMSNHYNDLDLFKAVLDACKNSPPADGEGWPVTRDADEWLGDGCSIVCLEPYHQHSHPVMLTRARMSKR